MLNLLSFLSPARIIKGLLLLLSGIIALCIAFFKGKSDEKLSANATNVQAAEKAIEEVLDAEHKISAMSDNDLNAGLRK